MVVVIVIVIVIVIIIMIRISIVIVIVNGNSSSNQNSNSHNNINMMVVMIVIVIGTITSLGQPGEPIGHRVAKEAAEGGQSRQSRPGSQIAGQGGGQRRPRQAK